MIPRPGDVLVGHWYPVDAEEESRRPKEMDCLSLHGGVYRALQVLTPTISPGFIGTAGIGVEVPDGRVWILEQVKVEFYHATGWTGSKTFRIDQMVPPAIINPVTKAWSYTQVSTYNYATDLMTSTSRQAVFFLWRNRPVLYTDGGGNVGVSYPKIMHPIWPSRSVMVFKCSVASGSGVQDVSKIEVNMLIQDVPIGSQLLEDLRTGNRIADPELMREIACIGVAGAITGGSR